MKTTETADPAVGPAAPGSAWVRIFVSEDGKREYLADVVNMPADAISDAMEYLRKRPMLAAGPLLRIFASHWRAGYNLNKPDNPLIGGKEIKQEHDKTTLNRPRNGGGTK